MFIINRIVLLLNWLAIVSLLLSYSATWINPQVWILPAFFGLAFPFIFLANLIFVVYWLIFSKFRMIYSGVILVFGFSYWNRTFNIYGIDKISNTTAEVSKVISFNVRLFDLYNWTDNKKTRNRIFDFLNKQDADFYCFQEFFHQEKPTPFITRDTLIKILRAKNYSDAYTHKLLNRQFFGLAIFTSYPIIGKGEIKFESDANNNAMWIDVKRKSDTLRIYNVHLSSIRFQKSDYKYLGVNMGNGYSKDKEKEQKILSRLSNAWIKRGEQAMKVIEHSKKSPFPFILCGDFNDTPVSYCYSLFAREMIDAFTESGSGIGTTYTGDIPLLRIDYIWHSSKLNAANFKVHTELNLSDHYPISALIY